MGIPHLTDSDAIRAILPEATWEPSTAESIVGGMRHLLLLESSEAVFAFVL